MVAIVYATTTGNTEALANAAKEAAGADAYFSTADSADSAEVLKADLIALGSPAMGAEQLEDSMESFYSSIEELERKNRRALWLIRLGRRRIPRRLERQS